MKTKLFITAIIITCLCLSACSGHELREDMSSNNNVPSSSKFQIETSFDSADSNEFAEYLPENDDVELNESTSAIDKNEKAELIQIFTEKFGKIAPSNIFASNFNENTSDNDGYYLYTAGCYILGDALESTYQYGVRSLQSQNLEDYPYTPAPIMDSALQEYFAIPSDKLHSLIENYDSEIEGYWAPMGGGGISSMTTIIECDIENDIATLSCETRSMASSESDPPISSIVTMKYSDEYGWRFLSLLLLDRPPRRSVTISRRLPWTGRV